MSIKVEHVFNDYETTAESKGSSSRFKHIS
jgi:hypothetical protein